MDKKFLDFVLQYYNKPGVGNTPENTGTCVGLVSAFMDIFQIPHEYGNAKDLLNYADTNYFDVIHNGPDNFPVLGDIVVFDGTWGNGYGHTGIVIAADVNIFSLFEANNPVGALPQILTHNYQGVSGWNHIKNQPTDTTGTLVSSFDNYWVYKT